MKTSALIACLLVAAAALPAAAADPAPRPTLPYTLPEGAKVKSTASGLQYVDVVEGTGATPQAGDLCIVHYSAWLEDGTLIDTSTKPRARDPRDPSKGEKVLPFGFKVGTGMVIPGWDEGVSTMREGGTRMLFIPSQLAYGTKGMGKVVPPDSRLTFRVELLKVKREDAAAPAAPPAPAAPR